MPMKYYTTIQMKTPEAPEVNKTAQGHWAGIYSKVLAQATSTL